MAVRPLSYPPSILSTKAFKAKSVAPEGLFRISGFAAGEPYFGASGMNRFDAPGARAGAAAFSVCYLGTTLQVAIAESILHDEMPVNGRFQIAREQVVDRYVHGFQGDELHLLDLTGAFLKRMGGSAELAGSTDYALTQRWSQAVYDNPARYDGFMYMSRHFNNRRAVALFDRARAKIHGSAYFELSSAPGFRNAARALGIELI